MFLALDFQHNDYGKVLNRGVLSLVNSREKLLCLRHDAENLHTSEVTPRAGTYPGFGSMVTPRPPPPQSPVLNSLLPIYTPGWKEALGDYSVFPSHNVSDQGPVS